MAIEDEVGLVDELVHGGGGLGDTGEVRDDAGVEALGTRKLPTPAA